MEVQKNLTSCVLTEVCCTSGSWTTAVSGNKFPWGIPTCYQSHGLITKVCSDKIQILCPEISKLIETDRRRMEMQRMEMQTLWKAEIPLTGQDHLVLAMIFCRRREEPPIQSQSLVTNSYAIQNDRSVC
jgi:hypothetical protein